MDRNDSFTAPSNELERLKIQLAEAQKDVMKLRSVIESVPDHIMLLDVAGTILDINHTVSDLSVKEVIGTSIFEHMSEDSRAEAAACLEKVWSTGETSSYETNYPQKDGGNLIFETRVALLLEDSQPSGLMAVSRDTTALLEALANLQFQSRVLSRSQKLANIGSWDHEISSGKLVWSDQVFRIFGLPEENFSATYETFLEAIHPDDREFVNETYSQAVTNKTPYDIVHRVLRPDGGIRVVRETSEDMRDTTGAVVRSMGIVHDITEQYAIQKELEESERFLSTLMANIPGTVYRCLNTQDWSMEYLSEGCRELTGYPSDELLGSSGRTFSSIIHPDDRAAVWANVQKAIEDRTFFECTYRITTAEGEIRWIWERGRGIFDKNGELEALEGFLTDYSTLKEEQQSRLNIERKIMNNQKLESLGLMAGGIAHDFNNLLTIILGNTDLALGDISQNSPTHEYLTKAELAGRRAADLVHQMLAYSGNSQFVVGDICVNGLLTEMTQMMEISISRTGLLEMNLGKEVPGIEGDVTQVRQVVMNLISNASEATEDQHGTIKVVSGSKWCDREYLDRTCATNLMMYSDSLPEGEYVYFEVSDMGSGMDSNVLDRIFDPFFTTKFTGRGLGLAATLGIIRGHRGTLLVLSEPGVGTTFRVLFPSCTKGKTDNRPELKSSESSWQGEGLILLADDEKMIRSLGSQMLKRLGFDVITVADGQAAVDEFEKNADDISLVILDLTMPILDGEEALEKILAHKPETRVILCSGFTLSDTSFGLKDENLPGFLHKPFTISDLREQLKKALA